MKQFLFRLAASTVLAAAAAAPAVAAEFPTKPVRVVVGYSAGGPTDVIARVIAQEMSNILGQPVVVDNKPGASSMIGTREVKAAPADGHTLLFTSLGMTVNPLLVGDKAGYNYKTDFVPISNAAVLPMVAVTAHDSPLKSIQDLLAKAKANPGAVSFGSSGTGGSGHLAGELLANQAGVKMLHVPYKGNGPALLEVMAGRVDFMFYPIVGIAEQVAGKRLKLLAAGTKTRLPQFPDVPTLSESGFPGFEETAPWVGMLAPARTPPAVVAKLNDAMVKALATPQVKAQMEKLGAVIVGDSPAQFANFLQRDHDRWEAVIKAAAIKME